MSDLTTKILIEIRDELKGVNTRLDSHERILLNQEEALVQIIDYEERHAKALQATRRRFDEIETRLSKLERKKRPLNG
jgi:hypothetical protein